MFGSRRNAAKLKYKVQPGGKIRYVDVCSLYPAGQYYDKFPQGHPLIINKLTTYDKKWNSIKYKVLPSRGFYNPVVPSKIKIK